MIQCTSSSAIEEENDIASFHLISDVLVLLSGIGLHTESAEFAVHSRVSVGYIQMSCIACNPQYAKGSMLMDSSLMLTSRKELIYMQHVNQRNSTITNTLPLTKVPYQHT